MSNIKKLTDLVQDICYEVESARYVTLSFTKVIVNAKAIIDLLDKIDEEAADNEEIRSASGKMRNYLNAIRTRRYGMAISCTADKDQLDAMINKLSAAVMAEMKCVQSETGKHINAHCPYCGSKRLQNGLIRTRHGYSGWNPEIYVRTSSQYSGETAEEQISRAMVCKDCGYVMMFVK